MAFTPFARDKHGSTSIAKDIGVGVLLAVFVSSMLAPRPGLAFEAELPLAPAQYLAAPRQSLSHGEMAGSVARDLESNARLAGTVQAMTAIETAHSQQAVAEHTAVAPVRESVATSDTPGLPLIMEGEASYYSRAGCLGCSPALTMANGQPLDDNALTMAIGADKKHLVGHRAEVTNLATGLSVTVTITDTGGFYKARYGHRVADLTIATKEAIGMKGGVAQVRVVVK